MTAPDLDPLLDIRRFLSSEDAQVWAVDTRTGGYRYLPDGEAADHRDKARAYWACPYPECANPQITTVGSKTRRDHFRHLVGGGHGDTESVFHVEAKAMLATWARETAPEADVAEERRFGPRRADVGITWPRPDQPHDAERDAPNDRLAFEVEYKVDGEAAWRTKHVGYEQDGVVDQWFFGHTSRHFSRRTSRDDMLRLGAVPMAVADRGLPVLLVNPHDRTVGTLVVHGYEEGLERWWVSEHLDKVGRRLPAPGDPLAYLVVSRLDDCRLTRDRGLVTPVMDEIAAERRALEERAAAERARLALRGPHRLHKTATDAPGRRLHQAPAGRRPGFDGTGDGPGREPDPRRPGWDPALAHCLYCASREARGLPVPKRYFNGVLIQWPSPGYVPWRDEDGNLIADPPEAARPD